MEEAAGLATGKETGDWIRGGKKKGKEKEKKREKEKKEKMVI